jgi:hypothetical protein
MSIEMVFVIAFFVGIAVVSTLIRNAYVKATKGGISGAVNRAVFKKNVQRGDVLIRRVFHYRTTRTEAQIRAALDAQLWNAENGFDHLFVIEDRPGLIRYAFYGNAPSRKLDRASFKADIDFKPALPGFDFQFISWLQDEDTMVNKVALEEMERLKYRIDQAVTLLDNTAKVVVEETR